MSGPVTSLSVVVPLYNGAETIGPLVDQVVAKLQGALKRLEVIVVNDGSADASHERALEAQRRHPEVVKYIRLARNFGEHNAVMCGLHHVTTECAAIIDDDFQNPPGEILRLVDKLNEGYDVVYSHYDVKRHNWFRNLGSRFNNLVATVVIGKPLGLYLSSFKVMRRLVVDGILQYTGPYPYIDGVIFNITDAIGQQRCEHAERAAGTSNYTFRRLVRLWLMMFTNFSVLPLRVASVLGIATSALGFLLAVLFVAAWAYGGVFRDVIPPGWTSLIVSIMIFSGVQMCLLGMIGEYLGRLFLTVNRTPQFYIRDSYGTGPAEGTRTP